MSENRFVLNNNELDQVATLVQVALKKYNKFDDREFLKDLPLMAYKLPSRLLRFLNDFKYNPPSEGYCVISNNIFESETLGLTPEHWQLESNGDTCKDTVMSMCLYSSILGDMLGWLTQQDGRVIHDVLPVRACEQEQLGCGSKEELCWHTEDAFHELRGDYLMLICMRNNGRIPTNIGKPNISKLSERQIDLLYEKHFTIRPDNSHKPENASKKRILVQEIDEDKKLSDAYNDMISRSEKPEKISVLFGHRNNPYLRIDPYFMDEPINVAAREALTALTELIEESIRPVCLQQGECVILDNYRVVHGRPAFSASYDGTDRWFKRINIIRDIRRCNPVLETSLSRVIY